jgi:hypothetical protein
VNNLSSTLRSGYPWSALRPVRLLRNILISILCAGFAGCVVADGQDWETDTVEANALSMNALSMNALSMNALSMNALSMNALSMNRLSADTLLVNAESAGELVATANGRQALQYIARCALAGGDHLRVEFDGQTWDFPGVLGLVPQWEHGALDTAGQEVMTACLLSHLNAFGISVPISARSPLLAEADVLESSVFYYGDGAFYGNLYRGSPEKFACKIRASRYIDESTGTVMTPASPSASQRVCAGERTAAECGVTFAGYCDQVCNTIEQDGDQWRFGDCLGTNGRRYHNVVTVWLEGERAQSCDVAPVGLTCDPN